MKTVKSVKSNSHLSPYREFTQTRLILEQTKHWIDIYHSLLWKWICSKLFFFRLNVSDAFIILDFLQLVRQSQISYLINFHCPIHFEWAYMRVDSHQLPEYLSIIVSLGLLMCLLFTHLSTVISLYPDDFTLQTTPSVSNSLKLV